MLLPACCASVMEEAAAQGKETSAAEIRRIAAELNTAEEKPAEEKPAEEKPTEEKPTEEIAAGKAVPGREASAAERRRIAAEVNTTEEKPTEEIAAGKSAQGNATQGKGTKTDEV